MMGFKNLKGIKKVVQAVAEAEKAAQAKTSAEPKTSAESKPAEKPYGNFFADMVRRISKEDVEKEGYKKGGYVRAADGCCKRGKTKGKMT